MKTKRNRAVKLSVECLEDRINPGIVAVVPNVADGLLDRTGPGLQNNGSYTRVNYGVEQQNNDDTGFKQNYWSQDIVFGSVGYIDTVFRVNNSQGTSEFRYEASIINRTGTAWRAFKVVLGFGTGANFTRMPLIPAGTSLDLDVPDRSMNDAPGGTDPGVGIRVVGTGGNTNYPAANRVHEHSWLRAWGANSQPNNGSAVWYFNVDVPESNARGIPTERQMQTPAGFQFTLRWLPTAQDGGNQLPIGTADTTTVQAGQSLSVAAAGLLANDTDPENDPLHVIAVNGVEQDIGTAITLASGAQLTVNADGSYTYVPAPGFAGQDTFTYTVTDGFDDALASTQVTINVTQAPSTTAITSSLNPSTFGQPVTFTATVTGSQGTPTGTATFTIDGVQQSPVPVANGQATFSPANPLTVGTHAVSVAYSGSALYTSSSASLTQTVSQASTTTTVVSSLNPSVVGQPVTFTATVSGVQGIMPTGMVTFKDGATVIGSGSLTAGQASFTISTLTAGIHQITAVYAGDSNYSGSTSGNLAQTVNQAPTTTTIASSLNPSMYGQSITFTATVSASQGTPTGMVTFTIDGVQQSPVTLANGQAVFSSAGPLTVGSHAVSATYNGNATYAVSSSGSLSQVVNQAATTTTVVSSLNPSTFGQPVTFTATVTGVQGMMPTGTVTFKDGATVIGSSTLAAGQASFMISMLGVGSHQITAVYAGDTNYSGSTSGILTQTVNQAPSTTTVASSMNPSMYGQPITFTATVTGGAPGIPTGTVTFKDGATVLGTGTLALVGGQAKATFTTTSPLSVAAHSITAVYAGDTSFAGSTSAVFTQTVNKAGTTTTMVSSSNPGHVGVPVTFTATVAPMMINQGQAAPTGTVQFWEIDPNTGQNIALLATVTLDATGHASFTTSFATMGMHRIKALYLGDANYLTSFVTFDEMVMM